jgi:hypothetical protein
MTLEYVWQFLQQLLKQLLKKRWVRSVKRCVADDAAIAVIYSRIDGLDAEFRDFLIDDTRYASATSTPTYVDSVLRLNQVVLFYAKYNCNKSQENNQLLNK